LWLTGLLVVASWGLTWHRTAPAQSPAARETYAELPGARIWYKDTGGDGVPVVFLHAATGSNRNWEYQIPAFVGAGFRFIAYDRRGWGRSVIDPAGKQPGTVVSRSQSGRHTALDRVGAPEPATGGADPRADHAPPAHVFSAGDDKRSHLVAHRRCRFVCAATGIEAFRGPDPRRRIPDRTG